MKTQSNIKKYNAIEGFNGHIIVDNAPQGIEDLEKLNQYQVGLVIHHALKHMMNGISGLDLKDFDEDKMCRREFTDLVPTAPKQRTGKVDAKTQALLDRLPEAIESEKVAKYCKKHELRPVVDLETLVEFTLHRSLNI